MSAVLALKVLLWAFVAFLCLTMVHLAWVNW